MRLGENAISSMWKKHQDVLSNNNDAQSIIKYGFLVRPQAQIVALRAHGAQGGALEDGNGIQNSKEDAWPSCWVSLPPKLPEGWIKASHNPPIVIEAPLQTQQQMMSL